MSIWISDQTTARRIIRRAFLPFLILPLAACLEGVPGGGAGAPALAKVMFYGGDVTVAGPRGYCIDPQSLKRSAAGSFALLASCESLTGTAGVVVDPAVMTVSVLPRQAGVSQPNAADMGRALAPADILLGYDGDGISLVHVKTGGRAVLPAGDPSYWRAGMVINDHLIGLAAYGPADGVVSGQGGRDLLMDLAEELRGQSPARAVAPDPGETVIDVASEQAVQPAVKAKPGLVMRFGGLFPVKG
ncbi:MAG: hypothetical protein RQ750_06125 [Roseovarius sp.]|nr:hypothetical protein [Roseovarius sp.]